MSVESNLGLHWLCFTTLCDWSGKPAPLSQPIRCKAKTNRELVTRIFPRLKTFTCIYCEFSLAPCEIFLCSDWPLWLPWFWFYDTQSKSALLHEFLTLIATSNYWLILFLIIDWFILPFVSGEIISFLYLFSVYFCWSHASKLFVSGQSTESNYLFVNYHGYFKLIMTRLWRYFRINVFFPLGALGQAGHVSDKLPVSQMIKKLLCASLT